MEGTLLYSTMLVEDVKAFYAWSQIIYCFFAAMILAVLWLRLRSFYMDQIQERITRQNGFLWIAFGIFFWVAAGTWVLYHNEIHARLGGYGYEMGTMLWSSLNNYCLLVALPYFHHRLQFFNRHEFIDLNWRLLCFCICILSITIGMGWVYFWPGKSLYLSYLPDTLVTLPMVILYAWYLYRAFDKQELKFIGIISVVALFFILVSQYSFLKFHQSMGEGDSNAVVYEFRARLFLLSSKFLLITIFIILIVTWITDLYKKSVQTIQRLASIALRRKNGDLFVNLLLPEAEKELKDHPLPEKYNALIETLRIFMEDKQNRGEEAWLNARSEAFKADLQEAKSKAAAFSNRLNRLTTELLGLEKKEDLFKTKRDGKATLFQIKIPADKIELDL